MEKRELHSVLTDFFNERLIQVTASGQAEKNDFLKAKIRPVLAKGALHFQAEEFIGKQAFHKNLTAEEAVDYLEGLMETCFRQLPLPARIAVYPGRGNPGSVPCGTWCPDEGRGNRPRKVR